MKLMTANAAHAGQVISRGTPFRNITLQTLVKIELLSFFLRNRNDHTA